MTLTTAERLTTMPKTETGTAEDLKGDLLTLNITLSSGKAYEIELTLVECAEDMDAIPDEISFYGRVLAALEREFVIADAGYRQWRAQYMCELLKNDPKLSEWKAKAEIEADEEFDRRKRDIAEISEGVFAVRAHINALLVLAGKANLAEPIPPRHEATGKGKGR